MSGAGAPEATHGARAARAARAAIEEALFLFPEIAVDFDRAGIRDQLLRAVQHTYTVQDNGALTLVHLMGLGEGAAIVEESRQLLERAAEGAAEGALGRALGRLDAAAAALRHGADEVSLHQLEHRDQIALGPLSAAMPLPRPFRASRDTPQLHALTRQPMVPHIFVDPAAPLPASAPPLAAVVPRPATLDELQQFAEDGVSGALAARVLDEPPPAAETAVTEDLGLVYSPAVEELSLYRRLGRDFIEDIANLRNLRKPNALESWLDQGPFEQRLLEKLDAFAALGGVALPVVPLFHAEAKMPDPERAFAVALVLGCIEGSDTTGAAVMTMKQSAPEELPGWFEGFWLAPSPAVDVAMSDLCASERPELVALGLDVLRARGRISDDLVASLLARAEPGIAQRVARALATALPRREAIDHLEHICATTDDDELFLAAVEALLQRGHRPALDVLRLAASSRARGATALPLLCLVGRAGDVDHLIGAARSDPSVRLLRGLGRFGHLESLGALVALLGHEDGEIVSAAAEALDLITGAELREIVEEPWEVELPPEAAEAGGIPVPTRKVERIVTDPERWSAWVRDSARHLEAKVKLRGGVPFTPMQIIDELEAKSTPPERREEAALELALVTGFSSTFSPHDWVARQKQHLAELRDHVSRTAFAPGAWAFGGASHPTRGSDAPVKQSIAQAPPVSTMQQEAAPTPPSIPRHAPGEAPLPAWASRIPGGYAGDQTLPPIEITESTRNPLPFGPPVGSSLFMSAPMDSPAAETLPPSELAAHDGVAKNPLPFSPAAPTPWGPGLPGASPNQELAQPPSSAPVITPRIWSLPQEPVLPFRRPSEPPGHPLIPELSRVQASPEAMPGQMGGPTSHLTLEQYASLCAELAVFPQQVETVFQRYGLGSRAERLTVDLAWQERLRQSPTEYREWQGLYQRYHSHLTNRARRGGT